MRGMDRSGSGSGRGENGIGTGGNGGEGEGNIISQPLRRSWNHLLNSDPRPSAIHHPRDGPMDWVNEFCNEKNGSDASAGRRLHQAGVGSTRTATRRLPIPCVAHRRNRARACPACSFFLSRHNSADAVDSFARTEGTVTYALHSCSIRGPC